MSCDGEEIRVRAPPSCSTTSPPPPADPPHTQPQPFADLSRIARAPPTPPHPLTPAPLLSPLMTCVLSVCSLSRRPVPSSPSSPSPPDAAHSLTVVSPHGCRRRVRWRLRERALPGHLPSPTWSLSTCGLLPGQGYSVRGRISRLRLTLRRYPTRHQRVRRIGQKSLTSIFAHMSQPMFA